MPNKNSQLVEAIFKVTRLMKRDMSYTSEMMHLSMLQLQALLFLKQKQNAQMREIAEHFHIELPSATSLLQKLHQMKLVKRQTDENDRRIVRILLTDAGEKLLKEAITARSKKIEKMLSYLSEKDSMDLSRILEVLTQKLEGIHEN
jgi:DNA-binding MarR family transcriptional regulator